MDQPPDWLGVCRRASAEIVAMLATYPATSQRAVEIGRGLGGDQTLVIDYDAEALVFAQLDALHASGYGFKVISEERGEVSYGDGPLVVVDPIDGSLNAKRGLPPHALSIAVANGTTMADVEFAYVYDFGAGEEWTATLGGGVMLNGQPLPPPAAERHTAEGKLELIALESASPRWLAQSSAELLEVAHRVRAFGSIAISLCQVAPTRVDAMATLWRCRAIDAAAAQLIVREAGGIVAFPAFDPPLAAPLDLAPHSAVIAARSATSLAQVARLPSSG